MDCSGPESIAEHIRQVFRLRRGVCRRQSAQQDEDGDEDEAEDDCLAHSRSLDAKFGPRATGLAQVPFELLRAQSVVQHASESNRVAEELQFSNRRAPDEH